MRAPSCLRRKRNQPRVTIAGQQCVFFAEPYPNSAIYKGSTIMSKGKDSKKQEKKKPLKTLMEKRAAKRAKKENKSFSLVVK
jgi:hypothetical protein